MRKVYFLIMALSVFSLNLTARSRCQENVIKETYTHSYGIIIGKSEWVRRGRDGTICSLMKDGSTILRSFNKGLLNGVTTYSFPYSSVVSVTEGYEKGHLISRKHHFTNGLPERQELFNELGERSKLTTWYEDSSPASVEVFEKGLLISGEYTNPFGKETTHVVNGNGIRSFFSLEGNLTAQDNITAGLMVKTITFYPNKDPATITSYENEMVHGLRHTFFPGGVPSTLEEWRHGRQDGTTIIFKNGQKVSEIPYVNGVRQGVEVRYNDRAELVEEISWKNDLLHGIRKIHAANIAKIEWYHMGKHVSRTTFERMNTTG
ncbi:toxin-antitoxin system YwqK family antitoxin [Candidatus Clavichlamydia salmonicola]|uniref:toxin-antitoxin system YwqK family antitoxin n=1 Tax=Candidatus Clavichlamydia salmonicola TaxID=469812 RepID=UPI001891A63C|nr:toxin-antitoxin system YwqK family antitoxin [Candidatus Clavichlamydia salmonicola]